MTTKKWHYLALGDSYTIGEAVPLDQNFPNQLCRMANAAGIQMEKPRIIAVTGWTTDELLKGIEQAEQVEKIENDHDLVSLLIGVNNQYRGRSIEEFSREFQLLLEKALAYAGGNKQRLVLLSIPDWGVTPFAKDRDRQQIAQEIDAFNQVISNIALRENIHYIYITPWTREAALAPALVAQDGLHPSAHEYERWSREILAYIKNF